MSPDELKWTEKCRELYPHARMMRIAGAATRRWRVYADLLFSVDGTTENGKMTECLISSGATPVEAATAFFGWVNDPRREAFYQDRLYRGERTDVEPFPLTPAELAQRKVNAENAKRAGEIASEGMRKHLHNQLKMMGLYDSAKRYHQKTGRLRLLFDKVFS